MPVARGGRIDPGYARWLMVCRCISALTAPPDAMARPPGPTPPCYLLLNIKPTYVTVSQFDFTRCYSERCCGIPASRARTSVSRYLR
jgi:hypothetical protein